MKILNEYEVRVLGALVEKQIATPEYYPLTLNALTNACNQKNHRDPVVSYTEGDVERALDGLRAKQLAFLFEGAVARVPKFGNTFAKAFELEPAEDEVLGVLLLRGPPTRWPSRSRSAHLHNFESLPAVDETLQKLASRAEPLVTKLPRAPGTKEARYAHLLGGAVAAATAEGEEAAENVAGVVVVSTKEQTEVIEPDRLAKLEAEVAALREEVNGLKSKWAALSGEAQG